MVATLLPYRDRIGEEEYLQCRELFCKELGRRLSAPRVLKRSHIYSEKLDKFYFKDREIARIALKNNIVGIKQLLEFQNNDEMVRYALEYNGGAIEYVDRRYLQNRELVRLAIEHSKDIDIMSLDCMKSFRKDKEYVYLACKIRKYNFKYVDKTFHDDYNLAVIVISDNDSKWVLGLNKMNIYCCLSDRLKDDFSLAIIDAASNTPSVWGYSSRLQDNEEIAEKLIEVHGINYFALRYMSERIKRKYGITDVAGEQSKRLREALLRDDEKIIITSDPDTAAEEVKKLREVLKK